MELNARLNKLEKERSSKNRESSFTFNSLLFAGFLAAAILIGKRPETMHFTRK